MDNIAKKEIMKIICVSAVAICICNGIFIVANHAIPAKTIGKEEDIPTTYNTIPLVNQTTPKDYVKANYNVNKIQNSSEYFQSVFESSITAEEAAEIGAQTIWKMLHTDLDGKTIVLYPCINNGKSTWSCGIEDAPSIVFEIDSVTGEVVRLGRQITKSDADLVEIHAADRPEAYDKYKNNCDEHVQAAKEYGEKFFGTKIVSCNFETMLATGDDASIMYVVIIVKVTDEYDRSLLISLTSNSRELLAIDAID